MKYRVVVNAGRNWESSFGQEYRRIAERCVYLEASSPEQVAERTKAIVQAVYPDANVSRRIMWSMNGPSRTLS
jgi:hypothetical protein